MVLRDQGARGGGGLKAEQSPDPTKRQHESLVFLGEPLAACEYDRGKSRRRQHLVIDAGYCAAMVNLPTAYISGAQSR
jgi:hypothetical protein